MKQIRKLSVDIPLYFVLPLLILLFPLRFVFAWVVAATVHELGHIVFARIFGVNVLLVKIGLYGAKIEATSTDNIGEFICVLGGPLFGSLLIALGKHMPYIALCATVQTIYNMLPLPGNDGERILEFLVRLIAPRYSVGVIRCFRLGCICILIYFCLRCLRFSFITLLIGIVILMKCVKIPCKQGKQIVQ